MNATFQTMNLQICFYCLFLIVISTDMKQSKIPGRILLLGILLALTSCLDHEDKLKSILAREQKAIPVSQLSKIEERGRLIAVTDYNSISYFVYRGEPMGYQYEMLRHFSEYLGVRLEIVVENDLENGFELINSGQCDLMAMSLTVTKERNKKIDFTDAYTQTRQMLVQRKPDNWRKMDTYDEVEEAMIRDPLDLAGKTIYIQKNSSYKKRLLNLSEEIGDTIYIIEDPDKEVEELIQAVANGEIDYSIADEYFALVNEKYYSNIDVNTPISFSQNVAWAVKQGNDSLKSRINEWLETYQPSLLARITYNKYFKNPRSVNIAQSEFHSITGGKISKYDDIIKRVSKKYNIDWRLLASLIYQESGFRPNARSWVGAYGLMQLMPTTASIYGIDSTSSLEEQITAGVKYLKWIDQHLPEDISDEERIKFVLASYNAGIAHVFDARRLAEKHEKDPNLWTDHVDFFLLNKSKPKYYRDSVVKYGYCRGEEPFNFVTEILERYEHYKNVLD